MDTPRPSAEPAIPLVDLQAQLEQIGNEIREAVLAVVDSGSYVLGSKVAAFEQAFAEYLGVRHCVGVNCGTSALHLALRCAGVGAGDEVITVPMTFIATAWAISYVGATPVFSDVEPFTYTMDVNQVEDRITPRTRAILPVHLYGQTADMGPLLDIGRRHGIPIIEDAAQAHGALYRDKKAGSLGLCGCFSFYPSKNLGALGEAGAVVTDDDHIAARLRALRDHAQVRRYRHNEIGYNYRMEAVQGAVLEVKLRHLEEWIRLRSLWAKRYRTFLADLPVTVPAEALGRRHAWNLYAVLLSRRDEIRKQLKNRNIHTGLHYPVPVHLQPAYHHLGHRPGDFPVAERIARDCLTLPLFPELTPMRQDRIVEALKIALGKENIP